MGGGAYDRRGGGGERPCPLPVNERRAWRAAWRRGVYEAPRSHVLRSARRGEGGLMRAARARVREPLLNASTGGMLSRRARRGA
eukprot:6969322-Prymnesium_polylepis.1